MAAQEEIITVKGKQYLVKIRVGEVNELTRQFEGVKIFEMSHLTSRNVVYARGVFSLVVPPQDSVTETIKLQQEEEARFCEEHREKVIAAVMSYMKDQGMDTSNMKIKPIMINQIAGQKIL